LNGLLKQHESEIQQLDQQLAELKQENETACQGINCQIEQSEGDTRVVTYQPAAGQESLFLLSPKELKLRLRRCDEKTRCLFAGSGQRFAWNYRPPIPLSES